MLGVLITIFQIIFLVAIFCFLVSILVAMILLIYKNNKEVKKMDLEKYGFRKDFDYNNRFDLKSKVGKYTISTVDLGMNHQFIEDFPPLYYETMIFNWKDTEDNPFEFYQERYRTEKEAKEGHKKAIKYVKEKLKEKEE